MIERGVAQTASHGGIVVQRLERSGQGDGVTGGDDEAALTVDDEFGAAAAVGDDGRHAVCHGLDDRPRKPFAFRRR